MLIRRMRRNTLGLRLIEMMLRFVNHPLGCSLLVCSPLHQPHQSKLPRPPEFLEGERFVTCNSCGTWWKGRAVALTVTVPEQAGVPGGLGS